MTLEERKFIKLAIDEAGILISEWIGIQNEDTIKEGGALIYRAFIDNKCTKVLNINTKVIGSWYPVTGWTKTEWFPLMMANNALIKFAWVTSEDIFSELSIDRAMPNMPGRIKRFDTVEEARKWLSDTES